LKTWKLACPLGPLGLAFPNTRGRIGAHSNIVIRGFAVAQVAAGLVGPDSKPKYGGLHAVRLFYASSCINRKDDGGLELPLKVVQTRLGHSTIQMTADTYGHLFRTADDGVELARAEAHPFCD
jgi:integrase